MCESRVVVVEGGKEKLLVEEAARLVFSEGKLTVWDIYGKEYTIEGVRELRVDFLGHTVKAVV